jgi:hypothetical protein
MDLEESNVFLFEVENEAHLIAKKEFLKRTKEISDFAVEVFKNRFTVDEIKGVPRQWDRIEESLIDELYNKYSREVKLFN